MQVFERQPKPDGVAPKAPELPTVLPDRHLGIHAQKFSYDFQSNDFTIGQLRGKAPLAPAWVPDQEIRR